MNRILSAGGKRIKKKYELFIIFLRSTLMWVFTAYQYGILEMVMKLIRKANLKRESGYHHLRYIAKIVFLMLPQKARCLNKENRYADIGKAVSGWHYINFSSGNEYIQNDKGEFVKRKKPER